MIPFTKFDKDRSKAPQTCEVCGEPAKSLYVSKRLAGIHLLRVGIVEDFAPDQVYALCHTHQRKEQ